MLSLTSATSKSCQQDMTLSKATTSHSAAQHGGRAIILRHSSEHFSNIKVCKQQNSGEISGGWEGVKPHQSAAVK